MSNIRQGNNGAVTVTQQEALNAWTRASKRLPETDADKDLTDIYDFIAQQPAQPVAQPSASATAAVGDAVLVGYFDPDVVAHFQDGSIDPVGVLRRKPNGISTVPVYIGAPSAPAVDSSASVHPGEAAAWQMRFDDAQRWIPCPPGDADEIRALGWQVRALGVIAPAQTSPQGGGQ